MAAAVSMTAAIAAAVTTTVSAAIATTISTVLRQRGHINTGNRDRACGKSQREHSQGR
jgi:hypothetical protein